MTIKADQSKSAGEAAGRGGAATHHAPEPALTTGAAARCVLGGGLMGLANLVPGISGGTMLVASGIYQRFIDAISDATRFRFRFRSLATLVLVVGSALAAIVLLAGAIGRAMEAARWVMYALFIGLTLGGLPVLLRMARPRTPGVWVAAGVGAVAMASVAVAQGASGGAGSEDRSSTLLVLAGVAGASAMILPGVSGAYLLLLLGQYRTILESIDRLRIALEDRALSVAMAEWVIVVPVGAGVLIGVVAVSNLLRWLLHRFEKVTLGVLIGLLLGAPAGLYPFKRGVEPEVGDVIRGREVTEANLPELLEAPEDWPEEAYAPGSGQIAGALGLIGVGFGATLLLSRLGRAEDDDESEDG